MTDKLTPGVSRRTDFFPSQGPPVGGNRPYVYDSATPADTGRFEVPERSAEHAILNMLQLSLVNPEALVALAQIELYVSDLTNARSRMALDALLDSWGQTIAGMDASELASLKRELGVGDEPP